MPKRRGDSKLARLPEHIREQLDHWLTVENLTYTAIREKLHLDFDVETGERALSIYYTEELFEVRNKRAADFADRVAASLVANPDKFDIATIAAVRQRAFNLAVAEDGDVKDLAILAGILGDTAKLKLKREELALSLERFRQQVKDDVEKGLDALHAEIAGNDDAETLFERLKAAVMQSVQGKAGA